MKVDEPSNRIVIPPALLERAEWICGTASIEAWLLVQAPDRYRLIASEEFERSPELSSLRAAALGWVDSVPDPLEFEDPALAVLPTRLLQVQLSPPPPAWRMNLPRIATELMHVGREDKTVALLFSRGYLEVWSLGALAAALSTPLNEILRTP